MKRRKFVKKTALALSAGVVLPGCGSPASEGGAPAIQTDGPRLRWRLVSSFTRSLDTIYGAAEVLAKRVEQLSQGRFVIQVYPGGELVPPFEVLESVQKGTVQMGHAASYYFIGKNPALAFDCTVPFGLTARQYNGWVYHGGGLELTRNMFADFNVRNFPGGNTGTQMGGWFNRELNALSDLRGLKMRIPGIGGRVMDNLGVTVQQIPSGEIYPALERGVIDAAEWSGPYDDEKLGFDKIARYYYYPGWWEPGPALTFYVRQQDWDGLPSDYQHILEVSTAEANLNMVALYDSLNPPALRRLLDAGTDLRAFPAEVMQAAYEASEAILEDGRSDPAYASIHDAYIAWRDNAWSWFRTSEHTYASFAYGRKAP